MHAIVKRTKVTGLHVLFRDYLHQAKGAVQPIKGTNMDPFTVISLAAAIGEVGELTKNIVSNMYRYYEAVKHAPKRSLEVRHELGMLCDLLDSLNDVTTKSDFTSLASLRQELSDFQNILNEMNERVTPSQTVGLKRLKWPFINDENSRYLSRISQIKQSLTLVLTIQTT